MLSNAFLNSYLIIYAFNRFYTTAKDILGEEGIIINKSSNLHSPKKKHINQAFIS